MPAQNDNGHLVRWGNDFHSWPGVIALYNKLGMAIIGGTSDHGSDLRFFFHAVWDDCAVPELCRDPGVCHGPLRRSREGERAELTGSSSRPTVRLCGGKSCVVGADIWVLYYKYYYCGGELGTATRKERGSAHA